MTKDRSKIFAESIIQLKKLILDELKNENVSIILFGSAARGDRHYGSDIDIAFLPKGEYDNSKIVLLREKIENMNIPYTVDLVDMSMVTEEFKNNILSDGDIWKS